VGAIGKQMLAVSFTRSILAYHFLNLDEPRLGHTLCKSNAVNLVQRLGDSGFMLPLVDSCPPATYDQDIFGWQF
jgi:hypothetical protein